VAGMPIANSDAGSLRIAARVMKPNEPARIATAVTLQLDAIADRQFTGRSRASVPLRLRTSQRAGLSGNFDLEIAINEADRA